MDCRDKFVDKKQLTNSLVVTLEMQFNEIPRF